MMGLFPNRSGRSTKGEASPANGQSDGKSRKPTRSWVWRGAKLAVTSPFSAVPMGQIVRNGQMIGEIASSLRRGRALPDIVPQGCNGKLDKAATAFLYGISLAEVEDRLARRRTFTAWTAYVSFGLGWLFVFLWVKRLLGLTWSGERMLTAVLFTPCCLAFFLLAFRQAYANWQLRTGDMGTAGDYLRSPAPFWPRP